ncbi:hypothetical protein TrVE_jg2735 [Triparma verrucosa]|uniref:Translation initiation factor IF-2, chloroplastic n=1 Tax=Triparma verrucosa TaxID=1606542 RepID=A0A9W7FNF6_9STRA|nr:hypothetical protein TrVE_jg2735 [Triparma verrucosa]
MSVPRIQKSYLTSAAVGGEETSSTEGSEGSPKRRFTPSPGRSPRRKDDGRGERKPGDRGPGNRGPGGPRGPRGEGGERGERGERGSYRGRAGGPGGQGGGGPRRSAPRGPMMKLENPMKVRRIKATPPPRAGGDRDQRGGPRGPGGPPGRGGRPQGNSNPNTRQNTNTPAWAQAPPPPGDDAGAKGGVAKRFGTAPPKKKADYDKKRSTPLRVGKRRNNVDKMKRRGSLKKRNRMSKEEKDQLRMEQNKVTLPDEENLGMDKIAEALDCKIGEVVKFCFSDLGMLVTANGQVDRSTAVKIVEGFGKIVADEDDEDDEYDEDEDEEEYDYETGLAWDEDEDDSLVTRPPVVTVMGHVDHGKTSLLDYIRSSTVTSGEAGGITQHIGAYQINNEGDPITFIDTPGHAAFSDMRSRGANITDLVILVVAADDSVKEQSSDSIRCARDAGCPIIVAVNKCDLETADPTKIKTELTQHDVLVEELGGDVLCEEISAKTGAGVQALLDKVKLQSEILDLKANPDRDAVGVVVEARVEKGLGTVATVLVNKGTLKIGDPFIAGSASGKVRALLGDDGKTRFQEALPSTPIKVVGFDGVPSAGDLFIVAEDQDTARELAESRARIAREQSSTTYQQALLGNVADLIANGIGGRKNRKEMSVVIKADVQGSAEALARALGELRIEDEESEVVVKVIVSEVGDVTRQDITLASIRKDTTIIAFNVAANMAAMEEQRLTGVEVGYYNIIYDAIDSVESRMQEVLSPTPEGEYKGSALIQEVFNIGGTGNIAGSKCRDGRIKKGALVRVMRGDKILIESKVKTLRNLKELVDTIDEGTECGIGLEGFEEFEVGDIIECYEEV